MEMESFGLLAQATGCLHVLAILVAMAAGFFGAFKARSMGVPPFGPMLIVFGVTMLAAVGLVFTLVEVLLMEWVEGLPYALLSLGGMTMDVVGTVSIVVGLLLLKKPALPPTPPAAQPMGGPA